MSRSNDASALAGLEIWPEQEAPPEGTHRFVVAVPETARQVPAHVLLYAIRNALVHEGRLGELAQELSSDLGVEEFVQLLEEVVQRLVVPPLAPDAVRQFTESELFELNEAGIDVASDEAEAVHPAARTGALYTSILASALSTREAAALLSVEESRVRQRLQERTLYGIKVGLRKRRSWQLPRFQFTEAGLVPGFDHVLGRLADDVHPVALYRWLTTPNPDLVVDDEPVTPLDWLTAGLDPDAPADLVAEL